MKNKILVLQHIEWEKPARLISDAAQRYSVKLRIIRTWKESIPQPFSYDALILLGGQSTFNDQHINPNRPSTKEEKRFLQAWLTLNKPCLGFSLGHELLAAAFHADIGPNFTTSFGFTKGYLTNNGTKHPIFKGITNPLSLFKWHDRAIQTPLPHNLITLATSNQCMVEAFSIKGRPNIVGLQCNNYSIHPDEIRLRLKKDSQLLKHVPDELVSNHLIIETAQKSFNDNRVNFIKLFKNFISFVKN